MNLNFKYLFVIFSVYIAIQPGCIRQPSAPVYYQNLAPASNGAYILCEGIWGSDNSSLERYNFSTDSITNNFYNLANPGLRLGDLAEDIVIWKSTAFITVTTAKTVEAIDVFTGKSKGRLIFEGHRAPRKICVIDDSLAVVTDLYDHSVSFFNPVSLKIIRENVPVGPAPEGVDCFNGFIYVANSGYGDYLATYPKAGYISILNTFSMSEIKTVYSGPDLIEVLVNRKNNRLYAAYINLPSKPDSFGGIVEYNLETLKETNRWLTHPKSLNLTSTGDTLLFLTKTGVSLIDLTPKNPVPTEILTNPSSTDIWYSLIYCALNNTIWIGNSKNYQTKGEISVYSFSTTPVFLKKFETGINPGKIVFY